MGVRAPVAMILALWPLGCGSSHTTPGSSGTLEGGTEPVDGAGGGSSDDGGAAAACDDFFEAAVGCSVYLSAAAAHDTPRFRQYCLVATSLPGSTYTASTLESCAQLMKANCSAECQFPLTGTLAAGAACNPGFDFQCQSGACVQLQLPDGGYPTCGICASSVAVGQACDSADAATACVSGSYCTGTTSKTCVVPGAEGATCSPTLRCQSGLFCSSSSQTCVTQGAIGATCSVDALQAECAASLPCVAGVCAPRAAARAPCTPSGFASPCESGLTCDSTTLTCVAPAVQPGGACGANGQLCVFGSCSTKGVCPTIIPDGQPCPVDDTQTCDDFAQCDRMGQCAIPGSPVCR